MVWSIFIVSQSTDVKSWNIIALILFLEEENEFTCLKLNANQNVFKGPQNLSSK